MYEKNTIYLYCYIIVHNKSTGGTFFRTHAQKMNTMQRKICVSFG